MKYDLTTPLEKAETIEAKEAMAGEILARLQAEKCVEIDEHGSACYTAGEAE